MSIYQVIANFIHILAQALTIAIIIRAILSWFMPNQSGGVMRILYDVTEPVLGPIRRVLPPLSGIDFSPILALILIQVVSTLLTQYLPTT